jgi:hypothetical protein
MKKKLTILTSLLFINIILFSQTNDVMIFSEKGEKFYLHVNGVQQNDQASSNVIGKDISTESFLVRIVFEDSSKPEITQNFWTESKNVQISAVVKQNKKGKYILRYNGENPKSSSTEIVESTTSEDATYEDPIQQEIPQTQPIHQKRPPKESVLIESNIEPEGEDKVDINISISDTGASINANDGNESVSIDMQISESNVSVNTDTNSDNVNVGINTTVTESYTYEETYTESENADFIIEEESVETVYEVDQSTGNCNYPMSNSDFEEAQESIKNKSFDDSKLKIAKQICKSSCMTSEQIRNIMKIFSFEESRLDFAKFAYDYVYNPEKYYKVNDAFQFELTIEELDEYLENK